MSTLLQLILFTALLVVLVLDIAIEARGGRGGGSRGSSGSRSRSSTRFSSKSKSNTVSNGRAKNTGGRNTNGQYNNKQNTVYVSRAVSNQRYDRFTEGAIVGYMIGSSQRRHYYYHHHRHDYDKKDTEFGEFVCKAEVDRSLLITARDITTTTTGRPELNSTVITSPIKTTSKRVMVYWKCADNEVCTSNDCQRTEGKGRSSSGWIWILLLILTTLVCVICLWCCIREEKGSGARGIVLDGPPPEVIYPRQQTDISVYYPAANNYTSGTQETMMGAPTTGYGVPMYPTTIGHSTHPQVMSPPPAYIPSDQKGSYGVTGIYSQQPPTGYSTMPQPNYANQ